MKAFALGCVVLLAACSLPSVGLWSGEGKADTGLYSLYGKRIVDGKVPYRSGFSMEFPPGAIPALALPALPGSHYVAWFKAFAFLCGVAAIGAIAYARPRHPYRAVVVAGVAPAALGPIVLNSFDLWPAALAAWAVALTVRGHERWGLALLGAATAAKLYPLLLAPVLLTYARDRWRAAAAGAAVVVAAFLPFAVLAPGGLKESLRVQAERGLQVESLGGSILGVAHRLGADVQVVVSHAPFSFDIGGRTAAALGWVSSLLMLVAVFAAWRLIRDDLFRAVAASAVAFVAFAKVLSPQYLLFLVPLVPLVDSVAASALLLVALGLTQVWARFPEPFLDTVHLGGRIWVVLVRNLVLVALYAFLLVTRRRRTTRSA
jgi:hypothetical protein